MESIQELRTLLQDEKVNTHGWSRPWGYRIFQRGPSIYITRALLRTRVKPNHVTYMSIAFGILGSLLMLSWESHWKVLGLFCMYLNILFDKVDGELARYHRIFSLRGIYWDEINHLIIPALFWVMTAYGMKDISVFLPIPLLTYAFFGSLALVVNRVVHSLAAQIYTKKYRKHPNHFELPKPPMGEVVFPSHTTLLVRALRIIHQFQDFFVIIASSTTVLFIERLYWRDYLWHPLFARYFVIMSGLFILCALENTIRKSWAVERDIAHINEQP